ncbi:DHA2 family efflux MFS transporter permease subunit [Streptomyces boninensis]|uniref:DHA2 family efflux MFS transporter permease subunit n=1 Tax=Streptomyces boninensis TaxID=2039455 RepID=UPI003B220924
MTTTESTPAAPPVTDTGPAPRAHRLRWFGLAVILAVEIMDLLDAMIVSIAAPSIRADFGGGSTMIQWTTAGYTLAFAILMITGARLGDIFGRRRLFLIGTLGFTLCSALCAAAVNSEMLIASRIAQGAVAALVVPQGFGLIKEMFPPKEMGGAFAVFGPVMGLSAVGGPVLGGWLTGADLFGLGWRSIFLINVPLGLFALLAAGRVLPAGRTAATTRLDLRGSALVGLGVLLLIFPLVQGHELGWPAWTYVSMAAALPVLAGFAWYQRRLRARGGSPLIEPSLFRNRAFVSALGVGTLIFAGMSGLMLIFTLYLQMGLGFSPMHAGTTVIPWALGMSIAAAASGIKLGEKYGRYGLQVGLVVAAAGIGWLVLTVHAAGAEVSSWQLAPALLVTGLGLGLGMGPFFDIALAGVTDEETGSASGVMNANQQLGASVGVAVLGTVFFETASGHDFTGAAQWTMGVAAVALVLASAAVFLLPRKAREGGGH